MTEYVTGQQARELLDAATPGPWTATEDHIMRLGWEKRERERSPWNDDDLIPWLADESDHVLMNPEPEWKPLTENRADMLLAAAAPELAATVAWMYGREPDGPGPHAHRGRISQYDQEAVASHPETGVVEVYVAHDHGEESAFLTPDDAVDLARALLAAAEKARRHTD